jgi:hypothetical protein
MLRILVTVNLLVASLLLVTCERSDMFNLAKFGLPPQTVIYLFPLVQYTGNLGGRDDIDNMCYNVGIMYHSFVKAGTVKGFISVSLIDDLRLLIPTQFWKYPVVGLSPSLVPTLISSTWAGLLAGSMVNSIDSALGIPALNWWSGSNADGGFNTVNNCSEWHTSDSASMGQVGLSGISSGTLTCDLPAYLLCVAY